MKIKNEEQLVEVINSLEEKVWEWQQDLNLEEGKCFEHLDAFFDSVVLSDDETYTEEYLVENGYPIRPEILENGGLRVKLDYVDFLQNLLEQYETLHKENEKEREELERSRKEQEKEFEKFVMNEIKEGRY